MPTLYEQLGVSRHASAEEIASAYRQKALIEHPDKNREDEGARERFQALDNVYRVLLDDEKRRTAGCWCAWTGRPSARSGPRWLFQTAARIV